MSRHRDLIHLAKLSPELLFSVESELPLPEPFDDLPLPGRSLKRSLSLIESVERGFDLLEQHPFTAIENRKVLATGSDLSQIESPLSRLSELVEPVGIFSIECRHFGSKRFKPRSRETELLLLSILFELAKTE